MLFKLLNKFHTNKKQKTNNKNIRNTKPYSHEKKDTLKWIQNIKI